MSPPTRSGAPPQSPATAQTVPAPQDDQHRQDSRDGRHRQPVVARAVGLPPCGARGYWAWVVGRCPYCAGSHLHRGGHNGGVRRAGCGAGEYQVTARRWSR